MYTHISTQANMIRFYIMVVFLKNVTAKYYSRKYEIALFLLNVGFQQANDLLDKTRNPHGCSFLKQTQH